MVVEPMMLNAFPCHFAKISNFLATYFTVVLQRLSIAWTPLSDLADLSPLAGAIHPLVALTLPCPGVDLPQHYVSLCRLCSVPAGFEGLSQDVVGVLQVCCGGDVFFLCKGDSFSASFSEGVLFLFFLSEMVMWFYL